MMQSFDNGADSQGFREINVTPLVDVMLVLLIVFMVTAPLLHGGLTVELPEVGDETAPASKAAVVTITREGRIYLGEREVTVDVPRALREEPSAHGPAGLQVRADRDVRYDVVATVLAAARAEGIGKIDLVVDPNREPGG